MHATTTTTTDRRAAKGSGRKKKDSGGEDRAAREERQGTRPKESSPLHRVSWRNLSTGVAPLCRSTHTGLPSFLSLLSAPPPSSTDRPVLVVGTLPTCINVPFFFPPFVKVADDGPLSETPDPCRGRREVASPSILYRSRLAPMAVEKTSRHCTRQGAPRTPSEQKQKSPYWKRKKEVAHQTAVSASKRFIVLFFFCQGVADCML